MTTKLAIEGGPAIRSSNLSYGRQTIDELDLKAIQEVLYSNFLTTGPKVSEFEQEFAKKVHAQYAVAVNNGTAALHTALYSIGIKPGDEVITTPFSFAATANSIRFLGGTVVFADIRPDTYNIDCTKIEELITKSTRAIIPVDFAGHPADLEEIKALAKHYKLKVIEDAAHALGAVYKKRQIGSYSDLTTFSFHPVKHITTGEGGMITTNDKALALKMRAFRTHGISFDYKKRELENSWIYDMPELGYNYRLTDIQAALGLSQLQKLDFWVKIRREIAKKYTEAFRTLSQLILPSTLPECNSSWHLYVIRVNLEQMRVGREQIFKALRAENIGVNVHYIPIPWLSYYKNLGYQKGQWPITEKIYESIISLPIWPGMSNKDIDDTISAVYKVIEAYKQ